VVAYQCYQIRSTEVNNREHPNARRARYILILLSGFAWPFFLASCGDVVEKGALRLAGEFCEITFLHDDATGRFRWNGIRKAFASDAIIGEVCMILN
jgi:hypothetical protein